MCLSPRVVTCFTCPGPRMREKGTTELTMTPGSMQDEQEPSERASVALQHQAPRLILDTHDVLRPSLKSSSMVTLSVLSTTTEAMVADRSRLQGRKERVTEKGAGCHEYGPISIRSLRKILDVRDSRRKDQLWLQSGDFHPW